MIGAGRHSFRDLPRKLACKVQSAVALSVGQIRGEVEEVMASCEQVVDVERMGKAVPRAYRASHHAVGGRSDEVSESGRLGRGRSFDECVEHCACWGLEVRQF